MNKITILSVNFHNTFELLLNHTLTAHLNSNNLRNFSWFIADNTFDCDPIKVHKDSNISVFEGISKKKKLQMSLHHGSALNILRDHISSEFVLIIDPDFFILTKNWLSIVIEYMKKKNLTFFGTPWHPAGPKGIKWFDFPNCHFLLIDLKKININEIDFRPAVGEYLDDKLIKSRDTGYRIRYKYKDDKFLKNELMKPDFISENFKTDLENLGISKDSISKSEFYKSPDLIKGFHLRRTQSFVRLLDITTSKKLFSLFVKYSVN